MPYCDEVLEGLLGSNIVGFQTDGHARNFLEAVDAGLHASVDTASGLITRGDGADVAVRAYPISAEWPSRWADSMNPTMAALASGGSSSLSTFSACTVNT